MVAGKPRLLSGGVGDSPQINSAGQIVDVAFAEQGVRHGPWSRDRLLYWASPASRYRTIYQAKQSISTHRQRWSTLPGIRPER